ncbi:MAG: hypothetical protein OEX00_00435 [Gammaproteobacteria bacterium]|nr:hypothetical protein [Gammaproteobacteria bacterium]MDH5788613.1 hypothetical protein [Candidatus Bathyarchaeota archaeon]
MATSLFVGSSHAGPRKCLYVSSYHVGYAWSDGIEAGFRQHIGTACELRLFYMDSKRHSSEKEIETAAKNAKSLIDEWKPDIVIVSDDNAAKFLVVPYLKNSDLPVVFSGLNWTVREYGFPTKNITGMVEVAPVTELIQNLRRTLPKATRGVFIGTTLISSEKNYQRIKKAADLQQFTLEKFSPRSMDDWVTAYKKAQNYDFIYIDSQAGINGWDDKRALETVKKNTKIFSITYSGWMMPYTVFGMTKVPQEQGEWAAKTAQAILKGTSPEDIPIVPNILWDVQLNQELYDLVNVSLPKAILSKARKINITQ